MIQNTSPGFFKNFVYIFGSQMVALISGLIKALVIPVLLGLSDYGYWQIYAFYAVYIGVFTFGYGDGVYLRYGGFSLIDLPLHRVRRANALYLVVLALGAATLVAFAAANTNSQRQIVYLAIAANVAVLGITSIISLTLQATNEMRGYAILNSADKIFFTLALLALFQEDFQTFEYLIATDLIAKMIVMVFLLHRYFQLFIGPMVSLADGAKEFSDSIGAGIQLLIANLCGMLVIGVGRIIVEYFGALESYAYYAFAVSLASVVLITITALSIAIYPILRRQSQDMYINYFNKTSEAYGVASIALLTCYFAAVAFVQLVATHYLPVIEFLNVMFITTVLQGKMQLVNNTYYKALRLERSMLVANFASTIVAISLSALGYAYTHSLLSVAYGTMATIALQAYASEIFLRRKMGEAFDPGHYFEIVVLALFLVVTTLAPPIIAFCFWILLVAPMGFLNRKKLVSFAGEALRRAS